MEAEIPVVEAQLYKGKIIVWDEAQANQLYQRGSYGKPLAGGKLHLAPVEALYLIEGGKLRVLDENGKPLKFKELSDIIKTGLKFGAHFRVYERGEKPGEAHSKFLVQAVPEGIKFTPTELARAVRLAHSVRKKILWAIVDDEGDVTYYALTRERP
jgi:tRNA-intron endonuclease